MTKDEHVKYWIKGAEDDLEAAESLYNAGKYNWCLFIAHLVLEKMLKALFVSGNDNTIPPKTHNLVKLAERSFVKLTDKKRIFGLTPNFGHFAFCKVEFRKILHAKSGLI